MNTIFNILNVLFAFTFLISCVSKEALSKPKSVYTSTEIDNIANWRFQYDLKEEKLCEIYILDGVPYERSSIDSVLKRFDKRDIRMISFLKKPDENTWWDKKCDLIPLIQTTLIEQKRQYKKETLNRIIEQYSQYYKKIKISGRYCDSCPAVFLNYKLLFDDEVVSILSKLKLDQIDFIADYQSPQNLALYGSKGKNGVIEIFMK